MELPEHLFARIAGHTDSEACFMLYLSLLERACGSLLERESRMCVRCVLCCG